MSIIQMDRLYIIKNNILINKSADLPENNANQSVVTFYT